MKREEVEHFLDLHGAQSNLWPENARDAVFEATAIDADDRDLLIAARELDARLDDWSVPDCDPALAARIAAAAPARAALTDVLTVPTVRLWQGALFATVPLLIGFLIAVTQTTPVSAQDAAWTQALEAELALMSSYGLLDPASTQ